MRPSPRELAVAARRLARRICTMASSASLRSQLDDEMQFHNEMLARDFERAGLSAADAATAARRKFGSPLALRERSGDSWGFPALEQLGQDVRYGARMLRRNPTFTLIAVGAIGVAIGLNAGFFTLVDAFVWQPIPVARPERIVKLLTVDARGWTNIRFSYTDIVMLSARARTLADVVAYDAELVAFKSAADAKAITAAAGAVLPDYFAALGGSMQLGRSLSAGDAAGSRGPAIVLSDGFWARQFGRAPDVVGRDIVINGVHATVAGVARSEFIGINPLIPDFWIALTDAERLGVTPGRLRDPANRFIAVRARVADGVTIQQAEAELSGLMAEPAAAPGRRAELARIAGVQLMPNSSIVPATPQTALMIAPALLVVALVLVIACANLANLLLARALVRQREMAVRLALGASRTRLVRQLLTESLMVAIAGAALGFVLANWTVTVVSRSFFGAMPIQLGTVSLTLHAGWRVVAYTAGLALISVVAFGLTPALYATSPNLTPALKGEDVLFGSRMRRSAFRDWLVVAQVTGSIVLLVAAATLAGAVRDFAADESGLQARNVSVASLGLSASGHIPGTLAGDRTRFAARVASLPTVAATARAQQSPFAPWPLIHVSLVERGTLLAFPYNRITPRYFDVVGQPIVDGRAFSAGDSSSDSRVAIVTRAAARRLWPVGGAVGQTLRVASGRDSADRVVQVVGVAADAHSGMIWDGDGSGYVYLPASLADFAALEMPLLVRTTTKDPALGRALTDIAETIDPNAPLHVDELSTLHDVQIIPFRYGAAITFAVALLGLALAVLGLYGMIAFAVRQRRRDIAVHLALGATSANVLALVLRREMRLVCVGLAIGSVFALGEARLIASLTLPLASLGAVAFAGIVLLMFVVALCATTVPALGALRIAPMQVLRQD